MSITLVTDPTRSPQNIDPLQEALCEQLVQAIDDDEDAAEIERLFIAFRNKKIAEVKEKKLPQNDSVDDNRWISRFDKSCTNFGMDHWTGPGDFWKSFLKRKIRVADSNGNFVELNPVQFAAARGNGAIVETLLHQLTVNSLENSPCYETLPETKTLRYGWIKHPYHADSNALHLALRSENKQAIYAILIHLETLSPDCLSIVNQQDGEGNTPLHLAAKFNEGKNSDGSPAIIQRLIKLGASKVLKNKEGKQPYELLPSPFVGKNGWLETLTPVEADYRKLTRSTIGSSSSSDDDVDDRDLIDKVVDHIVGSVDNFTQIGDSAPKSSSRSNSRQGSTFAKGSGNYYQAGGGGDEQQDQHQEPISYVPIHLVNAIKKVKAARKNDYVYQYLANANTDYLDELEEQLCALDTYLIQLNAELNADKVEGSKSEAGPKRLAFNGLCDQFNTQVVNTLILVQNKAEELQDQGPPPDLRLFKTGVMDKLKTLSDYPATRFVFWSLIVIGLLLGALTGIGLIAELVGVSLWFVIQAAFTWGAVTTVATGAAAGATTTVLSAGIATGIVGGGVLVGGAAGAAVATPAYIWYYGPPKSKFKDAINTLDDLAKYTPLTL